MIGCYVRVSTAEQSLDRQLERTTAYVEDEFPEADYRIYRDKSTGTDTDRSGYQDMIADAAAGELDAVVVHEISRICRSIRDLDRTADRLESVGVELHILSESLTMRPDVDDPYQRALFRLLGVFAELEAEIGQKRTKEGIAARHQDPEYAHGPAPLGYRKDDGRLVEGPDFDFVVGTLEQVDRGDLSKRKAADQLDASRRTIQRALEDRRRLYGL